MSLLLRLVLLQMSKSLGPFDIAGDALLSPMPDWYCGLTVDQAKEIAASMMPQAIASRDAWESLGYQAQGIIDLLTEISVSGTQAN